jgi:hypothetical protein
MIFSFCNTIYVLSYFSKFNPCASKTKTSHFSLLQRILPLFFVDDSIIFSCNLRENQTSKTKYLYFPTSTHILPTLIHLYFPLVDFVIFPVLHVEPVLSRCYCVYFPSLLRVLSVITMYTSRQYRMYFP